MRDIRASENIRSEPDIRNGIDAELLRTFDDTVGDAAILWDVTHGKMDVTVADIVQDAGLETAVIISLFTDARASEDDELPAGETDQRGWWGDDLNEIPGDITGSKLWLLCREKQQHKIVRRAEEYARQALAWLVEDGVAAKVDVTGTIPTRGVLHLAIAIHRADRRVANFKYDYNWRAQEYRRAS